MTHPAVRSGRKLFTYPGALAPQGASASSFVFLGAHTPHDPSTGKVVLSRSQLPQDAAGLLTTGVLFVDVQSDRMSAQVWQVLRNMDVALGALGSSLDHLAHLRIFLKNVTEEPLLLNALKAIRGDALPSCEIVGAGNGRLNPDIDVFMDAVAVTADSGLLIETLWVEGLERLTAPFPSATRAGPFLFTSAVAGVDPKTNEPPARIDQLTPQDQQLVQSCAPANARVEQFLVEQAAMWRNLRSLLERIGFSLGDVIYHGAWLRRPMRDLAYGSVARRLLPELGAYSMTCFPVSGVRRADALWEGRLIALAPDASLSKQAKTPTHGISNSYYGAIEVGDLVFMAGEVPVDVRAGRLIRHASDLEERRNMNFGHINEEMPVAAQADYVYRQIGLSLRSHGCGFANVMHQTVYMTEAGDYSAVERISLMHFGGALPPTSVVPVLGATAFQEALIEIEVTAAVGGAPS